MKPLISTALLRKALWATAVLNVAVAVLVLFPQSAPGQLAGLPREPAPPVYAALLAAMIALFGGAYAWMARAPRIPRALLGLAAIGKGAAFFIVLLLWTQYQTSGRLALLFVGDLAFAALFAGWLLGPDTREP